MPAKRSGEICHGAKVDGEGAGQSELVLIVQVPSAQTMCALWEKVSRQSSKDEHFETHDCSGKESWKTQRDMQTLSV